MKEKDTVVQGFIDSKIIIIFVLLVALVVGSYTRVKFYRDFRSLWVDESCLAMNIIEKNYLELLRPLDYEQGAPPGYLLAVKMFANTRGDYNEDTLRFVSLMSSLISLYLFAFISYKELGNLYSIFTTWIFAVHPGLIRFSSELKQYSTDVFVFLFLAVIGLRFLSSQRKWKNVILLLISGGIGIFSSHPAIFLIATIGILWFFDELRQKSLNKNFSKLLLCGIGWVAISSFLYLINYSTLNQNDYLNDFWEFGFPLRKEGWELLYWIIEQPFLLFNLRSENPYWGAASLLFLIGLIASIWTKDKRLLIFSLPICLTLLASFLNFYPFADRMILFLTPSVILFTGNGLRYLTQSIRGKQKIVIVSLSLLLITAIPLIWVVRPQERIVKREELKQVIKFVLREQENSDYFYVYNGGKCSFMYYAFQFKIPSDKYFIGSPEVENKNKTNDWKDALKRDIQTVSERERVWFVFSHYTFLNLNEALDIIEREGTILKSINFNQGASAYLVKFTVER